MGPKRTTQGRQTETQRSVWPTLKNLFALSGRRPNNRLRFIEQRKRKASWARRRLLSRYVANTIVAVVLSFAALHSGALAAKPTDAKGVSRGKKRGAAAQTPDLRKSLDGHIVGVKTPCGLFLTGSKDTAHFATLIPGREVAFLPPSSPRYWVVNEHLFESLFATESQIGAPPASFRGFELLEKYREWEVTWTADQNRWPRPDITVVTEGYTADRKTAYSIWSYPVPAPLVVLGQPISVVVYLTLALDDVIVVVSAPLRASDDLSNAHKVMQKIASGFERHHSLESLLTSVGIVQKTAERSRACRQFLDEVGPQLH